MKMRTLGRFVCLVLLVAAAGTLAVSSAQERMMGGAGITVFTDQNFRGRSSTFRQDVYDLEPLGINDKISSLRVGRGEQWEVCEHSNFQGRCVVVSGEEPDLRRNDWNDVISSLRRVRRGPVDPPSQGDSYLVLFDRTNYRGTPTNYNGPTPDLYSLSGRAQSVTIGRGAWELCTGRNYTGRCVTLDRSVPDLASYYLRNRVSSVRPVGSTDPTPPPSTDDWYIDLYDRTNYRGTPTRYQGPVNSINERVRSVTIGRGRWELCEGPDFTGRCVVIDRSVPNFAVYNLRNRVASLRPLRRQPRLD